MSDLENLYAKWLDQRTEELQRAAQSMLHSDDPEAAFRAVLEQPTEEGPAEPEANPLFDGIDSSMIRNEGDRLTLPDGRTVTREQVQEFLASYSGTLGDQAPTGAVVDGVELTSEAATALLEQAGADIEAEEERRRAAFSAEWRRGNAAPVGTYSRLGSD